MVRRSGVGDDLVGGSRRPCPSGAFYGQEAFFKTLKFRFGLDQFGRRATHAGRDERFVARFDSSF